jgi:Response regulator containing CheY-like receiver, AAA-type ATPase, and DNA-binding domains
MPLNVLVTDDSAVMRAMIVKTLHMTGVELGEVLQASNGAEALALLDERWVDLALVDINMPVMNGLELLQKIAERDYGGGMRTIVVSTEGSDPRIAAVRAYGAEFVHKPFTPEELRDAVLRVTGLMA